MIGADSGRRRDHNSDRRDHRYDSCLFETESVCGTKIEHAKGDEHHQDIADPDQQAVSDKERPIRNVANGEDAVGKGLDEIEDFTHQAHE